MLLDLKGDFYTWIEKETENLKFKERNLLCFGEENPSYFQNLISRGLSIEFKTLKDLSDLKSESYPAIFCPTFFLYNQKEINQKVAQKFCEILQEEGDIFLLFAPFWLPRKWSEEGAKMIKEGEKRLIFRVKNSTLSFCYYTNREIENLFFPLKLNRLIILQSGFRRVHLQKIKKEIL